MKDQTQEEPEPLISASKAAKAIDVNPKTLRDWTKDGLITCYRVGQRAKYLRSELLEDFKELAKDKVES